MRNKITCPYCHRKFYLKREPELTPEELTPEMVKKIVREIMAEQTTSEKLDEVACHNESQETPYMAPVRLESKITAVSVVEHTETGFGKKSKYYGLNIDGYVWDPYIDARWLPAQYLKWFRAYNGNTTKAVREEVSYNKAIKFTMESVDKMVLLCKKDPAAFEIERQFFGLSTCKHILLDYAVKLIAYLGKMIVSSLEKTIPGAEVQLNLSTGMILAGKCVECIRNHEVVKELEWSDEFKMLMNGIEKYNSNVYKACTFESLKKAVDRFEYIRIPKKYEPKLCNTFVHAYRKRGAWKTLAYLVRFEGYSIKSIHGDVYSGREAYEYLRSTLHEPDYWFHKMLKIALVDKGFTPVE